jgi:hypothetical protein
VLEYNPRTRLATLAVDDLAAIGVGAILTERLDAPQTIRELEIIVEAGTLRVHAWCGGREDGAGRLVDLMRDITARAADGALYGKYRYRVVSVASDGRLTLQAVRRGAGLPDVLPISIWPGVAAGAVKPDPGTEVLVEFIEGDRTMPIVSNFQTQSDGALEVAYKGSAVKVLLPPAVFSGVIGIVPASGVLTFPTGYTMGVVEVGTSHLRVQP